MSNSICAKAINFQDDLPCIDLKNYILFGVSGIKNCDHLTKPVHDLFLNFYSHATFLPRKEKRLLFIKILKTLFFKCFTILGEIDEGYFDLKNKLDIISSNMWSKYLVRPFVKAFCLCCSHLGKKVSIPFFKISVERPAIMNCLRQKKVITKTTTTMSVPVAVQKTGQSIKEEDAALLDAFKQSALHVPCGNPFLGLTYSLLLESLKCKFCVIPLGEPETKTYHLELQQSVLARNILYSIFLLPIRNSALAIKVKTKKKIHQVVICGGCGHCLNFGRGKFKNIYFPPTNIFYCKDQKEKQYIICATTGRIYCSYCGSPDIRAVPLIFNTNRGDWFIRAVIANNAVYAVASPNEELDVALPCLGSDHCSSFVIKRVEAKQLLDLTLFCLHFVCFKCSLSDGR